MESWILSSAAAKLRAAPRCWPIFNMLTAASAHTTSSGSEVLNSPDCAVEMLSTRTPNAGYTGASVSEKASTLVFSIRPLVQASAWSVCAVFQTNGNRKQRPGLHVTHLSSSRLTSCNTSAVRLSDTSSIWIKNLGYTSSRPLTRAHSSSQHASNPSFR